MQDLGLDDARAEQQVLLFGIQVVSWALGRGPSSVVLRCTRLNNTVDTARGQILYLYWLIYSGECN